MTRRARDWAWGRHGLTLAQRLVLLALAEHADDHGTSCFPSLGLLERTTDLSRRGITNALNGLDGALIERDRGGPRRATRYRLLLSARNGDERTIGVALLGVLDTLGPLLMTLSAGVSPTPRVAPGKREQPADDRHPDQDNPGRTG